MKKSLLFVVMLTAATVFLCGCTDEPEETGEFDYEAMDREFGQLKEEEIPKEDQEFFDEEAVEIKSEVYDYARCMLDRDAARCVEMMPRNFIAGLAKNAGCSEAESREIVETYVKQFFNGLDPKYSDLADRRDSGDDYSVELKSVARYYQESTVIKKYADIGIEVTDVADIDFYITVNNKSQDADFRLVKLESGEWKFDMNFFGSSGEE